MLIDALAPLRMPFNINDAIHLLAEKSGSHVDVCERTIRRDLELLVDMNFAHVHREPIRGTRGAGKVITKYKMDLVAIANIQRAARKAASAKANDES